MSLCRGFKASEFRDRVRRAQTAMQAQGLEALLLTTEADVRYFSGFLTRFWESPTRPWFLLVLAQGDPIAVIPAIGAALMEKTWIRDIRTWRAPDYDDDGVSMLAGTLCDLVSDRGAIGVPSGIESHLRMPLNDWHRLGAAIGSRRLVDDGFVLRDLRMVKSEAEISKISNACAVASRAFDRMPEIATCGRALSEVFRRFQMLCLEEGADWVPYLAGGAGPDGYSDVISPASDRPLAAGDVLMLDTGLVVDGYFCDFDRNFSLGPPSRRVADAHATLIQATHAAFDIAQPGRRAADLFHAMDKIVTDGAGGSEAGRLGHGLGMQLTEAPSLIARDETVLAAGMVLTLEPGIVVTKDRIMVHEENIVIRKNGAEWLSRPAPAKIRELPL
jgi:Xaa-Pro aminopeptidase